jgi:lambda family phage tail tape measure protein
MEGFNGMTEALVQFVTKGRFSFKSLADSIIADMVRIAVQASITAPLMGAFGGFLGGVFASLWGSGAAVAESIGPAAILMAGKGRVFDGGNVTPFAAGGIVSHPTVFPMASGGLGLMGEAGPEAVMPLIRGSNGKLGVSAEGGGPLTVNVLLDREVLYKVIHKGQRTGELNLQLA